MDNTDLRHHCYAMGYSDGEVGAFYDGYEKGGADKIDECIDILNDSIPYSANADVIYGFYCATERLKQLKEQK